MGSGSSARKTAAIAAEAAEELKADGAARAKYRASGTFESESSSCGAASSNVRSCDRCGEVRKTSRCGGQGFLCVVCQMDSGAKPSPKPRRVSENQPEAPQPLRRSMSDLDAEKSEGAGSRRRRRQPTGAPAPASEESEPEGPKVRGARRAGKERAAAQEEGAKAAAPRPSLNVLEDRQGFRGLKGLNELRGSLTRSTSGQPSLPSGDEDDKDEKHPPPVPIPTSKRKLRLPGGFHCGDRVASLVTRARRGLQVLEFGNQGTVVGAKGDDDVGEEVRLLVQFDGGVDWFLSPDQLCLATALAEAKAAGLSKFTWGTRVRSLVTYMCPEGARTSVWLGDPGTVLGPGRTPGKLAVRFDASCSEWSVWPSALCEESDFPALVQEKLAGGFSRGDRVRTVVRVTGSRSCAGGPQVVAPGDEGTVVGPGHAAGRLLVHFDHDHRMWSLSSDQVTR